jgi:bifunctional non-homologous end joining protein LigD
MHPAHSSVMDYQRCHESQDHDDIGCGLNLPDFVILDLDPYLYANSQNQEKLKKEKEEEKDHNSIEAFRSTVEAALELSELLKELHLRSYFKTSEKADLHILIPVLKTRKGFDPITYETTREFAKNICNLLIEGIPQKVTLEWNVKERSGKVFFDHNQNS